MKGRFSAPGMWPGLRVERLDIAAEALGSAGVEQRPAAQACLQGICVHRAGQRRAQRQRRQSRRRPRCRFRRCLVPPMRPGRRRAPRPHHARASAASTRCGWRSSRRCGRRQPPAPRAPLPAARRSRRRLPASAAGGGRPRRQPASGRTSRGPGRCAARRAGGVRACRRAPAPGSARSKLASSRHSGVPCASRAARSSTLIRVVWVFMLGMLTGWVGGFIPPWVTPCPVRCGCAGASRPAPRRRSAPCPATASPVTGSSNSSTP